MNPEVGPHLGKTKTWVAGLPRAESFGQRDSVLPALVETNAGHGRAWSRRKSSRYPVSPDAAAMCTSFSSGIPTQANAMLAIADHDVADHIVNVFGGP